MRPIDNLREKIDLWKKSTTDTALMSVLHDVLKQIDVAIYEMDHQEAESPWHRVEEELPNDGEWAIFTNGKVVSVERFKVDAYNHFFPASEWFDFEDAIAWMPLPEPPKEDA